MKTEKDVRLADALLSNYHAMLTLFDEVSRGIHVGVTVKSRTGSYYSFVDLNDHALDGSFYTTSTKLAHLHDIASKKAISAIAVSVHNKVLSEIAGLIHHYKRELLKLGVSTDAPLPAPVASYEITENPNATIAEE